MKKPSSGLLVYRRLGGNAEVLLEHPGGPFFAKKDNGSWSIPKGQFEEGEDSHAAAEREFTEETGQKVPSGPQIDLGSITRTDGKVISVWAVEGDLDLATFTSNTFEMEWPPKSGRMQQFPEVDRVAWMSLSEAARKLNAAQIPFIERLATHLSTAIEPEEPRQFSLF